MIPTTKIPKYLQKPKYALPGVSAYTAKDVAVVAVECAHEAETDVDGLREICQEILRLTEPK